ncbi:hypothetical protein MPTK1_6g04540 [Marchantia polymorpha subsp. ruderalis]|nr:hypothetical protein MARPO_0034s0062 [Marchantia polymorpha]BBN13557.1 hypothetical protein Mp_6g04540 [Marchantia polymorpha subsp. ruderalis]|eukprot:PTQ41475.1 hypothetical protein MARPO_0034s0062 [Marchantia polymorpha]
MSVGVKGMEPKTGISDLPDEILQICFARLPLRHLPMVRVVCTRWRNLGSSQLLRCLRRSLGLTQTCTFVIKNEYISGSYRGLQVRDIDSRSLATDSIATLDGPQRLQFGAAGADGLIYILGGRSPLICRKSTLKAWIVYSRVDVYEPLNNCWFQLPPMRRARFGFAVGAFVNSVTSGSKLIVAGGFDGEGEALSVAEVFDFGLGHWTPIPSMCSMAGPCTGEVVEGKFYVQRANSKADSFEVYDPSVGRWTTHDAMINFCMLTFHMPDRYGAPQTVTVDL